MAEAVRPQKKRKRARDKKVSNEPALNKPLKIVADIRLDDGNKEEPNENTLSNEKGADQEPTVEEDTEVVRSKSDNQTQDGNENGSAVDNIDALDSCENEVSLENDPGTTREVGNEINCVNEGNEPALQIKEIDSEKEGMSTKEVEPEDADIYSTSAKENNLEERMNEVSLSSVKFESAEMQMPISAESVTNVSVPIFDHKEATNELEDVARNEIASEVSRDQNKWQVSIANDTEAEKQKEIATEDNRLIGDQSVHEVVSTDYLSVPTAICKPETLIPFTEEQLKSFYCNQELDQVPVFIDEFLQNINRDTHELHELVNSYYRCRISLLKLIDQLQATKSLVVSGRDQIWTLRNFSITEKGQCRDKLQVSASADYRKAEYNERNAASLKKLLKDMRQYVHEDFQLKSFNSQLSRIRVQNYIHEMIKMSPLLQAITTDSSLSAKLPRNLRQDDVMGLRALQDAITILFHFKRFGNVEEEFCNDVNTWLNLLVSILQRAGALPDYFFILNHVLRCPPGSVPEIASCIQFPEFTSTHCDDIWNSPLVHHFVVMLATIALPVKERENCLMRFKQEMNPTMNRSISWTLIDENREEDENPEESWHLLTENDLVALFEQFPFEGLFQYLLFMNNAEGEISYSPTFSTSNDIVRLLAFASCIVEILGQIFDTYNLLRYRQFVKRISRTIRWVVQVVSDHWCAYRSWRMEICGDSDKDIPNVLTVATQFSLERLQLEFDQFFTKATMRILSSQSIGALQFLASMPYDAISTNASWLVLNNLLAKSSNESTVSSSQLPKSGQKIWSSGQMIYLFSALSNMAISRSKDDREFIDFAASSLLELTFSNTDHHIYMRDCRDVLSAIAATHPFVMSSIICNIGKLKEEYLESCVYLLKALPLDLWYPETKDLELIRNWLLGFSITSKQNQLARTVLSEMNFDLKPESGILFLPKKFHFAIAVMLVEVYGSCVPDGPGGLKKLEYERTGIFNQVGTFAFESINKILQAQPQSEFLRWCMDVMMSLKLHKNDYEATGMSNEEQNILLSIDETQVQGNGSWFNAILSSFENFCPENAELEHCPELLNVKRAFQSDGVLACYLTLMMTKTGHSPDSFLSHGLDILRVILKSGWPDAVLRVISVVVPLFVKCSEMLSSSPGFHGVIDTLVHWDANRAGYTEKLFQYPDPGLNSQMLASIIINSVIARETSLSENAGAMMSCWFYLLTQSSNWHRDLSAVYLMDQLCKASYIAKGNVDVIVDHLFQQYESLISIQSHRGLLSSVMSWISTSSPITFLEIKKQPDYSYFAYAVLLMEKKYEEKLGVWRKMTSKLRAKPKLLADAAFKKAVSHTKAVYVPIFQHLNIYRWMEQGLATNIGHPLLPLIWQQFFMLFLEKQDTVGGLPSRVGVGYRFLDRDLQPGLAKKIRGHLNSAACHHKEKSLPKDNDVNTETATGEDIKSHIHEETVHATLASLYQAMALWIEESRLHDPSLVLDALPDIYKPAELTKIFQGDREPWMQYVDKSCIEKEVESMRSLWTMSISGSTKTHRLSKEESQQLKPIASQRILKRLQRESKPLQAPSVLVPDSPIPEVSLQLLLTRPRLIQDLSSYLEAILLFAKKSCLEFDENTALDEEYLDLMADLFSNVSMRVARDVPCKRSHPCSGPARIILTYEEAEMNTRNQRRLEENQNTWNGKLESYVEPLPHSLCVGAVYVETVIKMLVKSLQYANAEQRSALESACVELFYLLAELINIDVKRNSPAIQFFSSGTETLGKEMIVDNEVEQPRLIKTILAEEASISFLAPHFNPSPNFRTFLQLYSTTAEMFSEDKLTALFVLFSKFDVRTWLTLAPSQSDSLFLVRTIVATMENFGKEPREDLAMIFGLFRSHMELLLRYRFPQQFVDVFKLLLESCQRGKLPSICLNDFSTIIGCVDNGGYASPQTTPCQLGVNEAYEAIKWLCEFSSQLHSSYNYCNSKLYSEWKLYIPYMARLLPFVFSKFVESFSFSDSSSAFSKERCLSAWNDLFNIYRPWIVPHQADSSWPTLYIADSLLFIQCFTESARLLSNLTVFDGMFSFGLNMVWAFYCAEIAGTLRQENAHEIYHGLLMTLPWASFCPSLQGLNRMLELYSTNTTAFHFLGTIMCMLKWQLIIAQQSKHDSNSHMKDYLVAVLRIFVMLSTNKPFMAKTFTQFLQLIEQARSFSWFHLDVQNIEAVCGWYAANCDAKSIFKDDSHERTVLQLLKTTSLMEGNAEALSTNVNSEEVYEKQSAYVRMLVTIITRTASKPTTNLKKLTTVVSKLLSDIEHTARLPSGHLTQFYSTVLVLLNEVSGRSALSCIESQIHSFLSETNNVSVIVSVLSAACRVLAGLDQLVTLCETAIESFFNRQADEDFKDGWTHILSVFLVPELNEQQFVRKALSKNCLLTLYAYNLHRYAMCRDATEELKILKELFQWCNEIGPSPSGFEKSLLTWWQILNAVRRQVFTYTSDSQFTLISQFLRKFSRHCHQVSEDKKYSGVLGAIGLGKKSVFPPQFRLIARSLHIFILAQMPNAGTRIRNFPDAPGHVKASKSDLPNQDAKSGLQNLSILHKNKHYAPMKDDIAWVCEFIANPKKCLLDGPELLEYLCKQYFFKVSYVAATIRNEQA